MAKSAATLLLGEYGLYEVWRATGVAEQPYTGTLEVRALLREQLAAPAVHAVLRETHWYFGPEAHAFGCFDGESLVAVAYYWHGERYAKRSSWPIERGSAKLVNIVTAPSHRGRGAASELIRGSAAAMTGMGYKRLYSRIWHSNTPSKAAFRRAGWQPIGWLIQLNPLRRSRPWRIAWRLGTARPSADTLR